MIIKARTAIYFYLFHLFLYLNIYQYYVLFIHQLFYALLCTNQFLLKPYKFIFIYVMKFEIPYEICVNCTYFYDSLLLYSY